MVCALGSGRKSGWWESGWWEYALTMPDFTEAMAAIRRLPSLVVLGALMLAIVIISCTGHDLAPRTIGFELHSGR